MQRELGGTPTFSALKVVPARHLERALEQHSGGAQQIRHASRQLQHVGGRQFLLKTCVLLQNGISKLTLATLQTQVSKVELEFQGTNAISETLRLLCPL